MASGGHGGDPFPSFVADGGVCYDNDGDGEGGEVVPLEATFWGNEHHRGEIPQNEDDRHHWGKGSARVCVGGGAGGKGEGEGRGGVRRLCIEDGFEGERNRRKRKRGV